MRIPSLQMLFRPVPPVTQETEAAFTGLLQKRHIESVVITVTFLGVGFEALNIIRNKYTNTEDK